MNKTESVTVPENPKARTQFYNLLLRFGWITKRDVKRLRRGLPVSMKFLAADETAFQAYCRYGENMKELKSFLKANA